MNAKKTAALAAVVVLFLPALAFAQSCSVWFDQNPINAGGGTTLYWYVDNSGVFSGSLYINNVGEVNSCSQHEQGKLCTSPSSGSFWVAPGASTDYTGSINWMDYSKNTGTSYCAAVLYVNADPCPTYIETPWQGNGLLLYSGYTRKITQLGNNVCVTNNSGNHYFIPANTSGELQSFYNAAPSLGVSVY